nr:MAG TPA: hypothetical protein [Caudoviricetes sp.]
MTSPPHHAVYLPRQLFYLPIRNGKSTNRQSNE